MRLRPFVLGTAALLAAAAVAGTGPQGRDLRDITTGGGVSYYRDADRDGTLNVFDCNDDDGLVFPGADELWNGFDDDCDGTIDDGFDTTMERLATKHDRVLWPDGKAAIPSEWIALDATPRIVWTGTVFVVVWSDRGDNLRLARVTADGLLLDGTPRTLRGGARAPDIAWTGTRLAVVYEDRSNGGSDVRLLAVDRYGALLLDTLVHVDAYEPRIAWGQEQFGVLWRRAVCEGDCIGYRTFNRDGAPMDPIETMPHSARGATIAWSGTGTEANAIEWDVHPGTFGIVYEADDAGASPGDLLLVTRDPRGSLPGQLARVNAHDNVLAPGGAMASITGSPSGFAVSWHVFENGANSGHLRFFSTRDLESALEFFPDADRAFASSLAWTGSEFVVANENVAPAPLSGTDVHVRALDGTGNPHRDGNWGPWSERNVSAGAGGAISTRPSLANAGSILGVVWIEQEGAEAYGRLRFATLTHR